MAETNLQMLREAAADVALETTWCDRYFFRMVIDLVQIELKLAQPLKSVERREWEDEQKFMRAWLADERQRQARGEMDDG